jgi:hypothetical protein
MATSDKTMWVLAIFTCEGVIIDGESRQSDQTTDQGSDQEPE